MRKLYLMLLASALAVFTALPSLADGAADYTGDAAGTLIAELGNKLSTNLPLGLGVGLAIFGGIYVIRAIKKALSAGK